MCGRFYVESDEALEEKIHRLNRGLSVKAGDVRPGDGANVFFRDTALRAANLKWGFDGIGSKLVINARSETAAQKPMFRELFRSYRLLVPAHGYYEWDRGGKKHLLGTDGGMYLAGLYRPDRRSFVILTREAAPGIRYIHPRMPVIFAGKIASEWLNASNDPVRVLEACRTDAVHPMDAQMRLEV